uniref:Uncharacterized protein n=1 Tax=Amphiprion percula TaxID=161767 RepID=A0A3P8S1H8_AMPPE
MWRVSAGGLVSDWGASVRRLWRGLPPDLPHFSPSSPGSVYLFRGDSYWKFMFPGSSPLDGYPRSSAADWLDCTASSSPGVDDFSLSLSPPERAASRMPPPKVLPIFQSSSLWPKLP